MITFKLTKKQRETIAPCFHEVMEANRNDERPAILARILNDGAVKAYLLEERAVRQINESLRALKKS